VEDAIFAVHAYGEGLGFILEGVGWGFGALVADFDDTVGSGGFAAGDGVVGGLLGELEGDVGAVAMDGAGSDESADAEVAGVGLVAHLTHLADGDVVALVVADAGEGEPADGGDDDYRSDDNFDGAFGVGLRHKASVPFGITSLDSIIEGGAGLWGIL